MSSKELHLLGIQSSYSGVHVSGCRASDITLLSNVTTAVNAVLRSLKLTKESKIYYLNITYGKVIVVLMIE